MRSKTILGAAVGAALLLAAAACSDDEDGGGVATTTVAQGPTEIEVTLTADGFEGMPSELPAGLVEVTVVNESGDSASLDITRVPDGTTEDEFVVGLQPLLQGGPFPDLFQTNAGFQTDGGDTQPYTLVLEEGEHIVWYELATAGDTEETAEPGVVTAELTVTAGDDDAELPDAEGEIIARDHEFEATLDGPGTINFRNEGPQQFHHAVLMDFGTNDPAAVEEAFPSILESEGDPSPIEGAEDLDMDEVDFEFGGSGVFGPDGAAGTFEADIVPGHTYVLACFLQDRTGGPPHAIAHDMWEVVTAGGADAETETEDGDTSSTTDG